MAETARAFVHRRQINGNFASVCPDCFKTISSEQFESELRKAEITHVCNPALLRALWGPKKPPY
jgi:hypothetical protein